DACRPPAGWGEVAERRMAADGAWAGGGVSQARRKSDARPAADAGQHCDILLAAILIGRDVADDAGRSLELVELLAGLGVDRLQIAFKRAVEHHVAGGRERA